MSRLEVIGRSSKFEDFSPNEDEVAFTVVQGDLAHSIALTHTELDMVLEKGVQRLLGRKALHNFDFVVRLESPSLPFFIGVNSLYINSTHDKGTKINMDISVVSQSVVYEHRGVLSTIRRGGDAPWLVTGYEQQPPLKQAI